MCTPLLLVQAVGEFRVLYFFYGPTALVGQGLLTVQVPRSHTTCGRTPLDEGSARRRKLYLKTHNTRKRQTSQPPAGFEPAIQVSK